MLCVVGFAGQEEFGEGGRSNGLNSVMSYDCEISYWLGKKNNLADYISTAMLVAEVGPVPKIVEARISVIWDPVEKRPWVLLRSH